MCSWLCLRFLRDLCGCCRHSASWLKKINSQLQIRNNFIPWGFDIERALELRTLETYAQTNWAMILLGLSNASRLDTAAWADGSVPTASFLDTEFRALYRRIFAISAALDAYNTVQIMTSLTIPGQAVNSTLPGEVTESSRRVLISRVRFIISTVILCLFLLVIAIVYVRPRRQSFLPFMPTSLAARIALICEGSALEDAKGTAMLRTHQREVYLRELGHTYYFGWGARDVDDEHVLQFGLHKVESQ